MVDDALTIGRSPRPAPPFLLILEDEGRVRVHRSVPRKDGTNEVTFLRREWTHSTTARIHARGLGLHQVDRQVAPDSVISIPPPFILRPRPASGLYESLWVTVERSRKRSSLESVGFSGIAFSPTACGTSCRRRPTELELLQFVMERQGIGRISRPTRGLDDQRVWDWVAELGGAAEIPSEPTDWPGEAVIAPGAIVEPGFVLGSSCVGLMPILDLTPGDEVVFLLDGAGPKPLTIRVAPDLEGVALCTWFDRNRWTTQRLATRPRGGEVTFEIEGGVHVESMVVGRRGGSIVLYAPVGSTDEDIVDRDFRSVVTRRLDVDLGSTENRTDDHRRVYLGIHLPTYDIPGVWSMSRLGTVWVKLTREEIASGGAVVETDVRPDPSFELVIQDEAGIERVRHDCRVR
ncbi:MAG: hypothetical protein R3F20_02215 [Planctomycetota bacterium]